MGRNPRSTFLYFPTPLKSLPRPAEVLQQKTESDDSWGRPAGSLRRAAATTPGGSLGKPAKGCGDYSWGRPAEAREGLRRLLLGEACGKLAKWRELAAKWRELAAKLGAKTAKWRELAAKLGAKTAKWRELAAKQLVAVSGS